MCGLTKSGVISSSQATCSQSQCAISLAYSSPHSDITATSFGLLLAPTLTFSSFRTVNSEALSITCGRESTVAPIPVRYTDHLRCASYPGGNVEMAPFEGSPDQRRRAARPATRTYRTCQRRTPHQITPHLDFRVSSRDYLRQEELAAIGILAGVGLGERPRVRSTGHPLCYIRETRAQTARARNGTLQETGAPPPAAQATCAA